MLVRRALGWSDVVRQHTPIEKRDYEARRRSGSTIVYAYDYEGTSRSNTLVTYGVVEWLKAGDKVSVLVDPTNLERTLLPGAYRRPLPE